MFCPPCIVRATGAKPAPLEAQGKRSKPVNYSEAHALTFHRGYSLSYWNRKSTDRTQYLSTNEFIGCWSYKAPPLANSGSKEDLSCTCVTN